MKKSKMFFIIITGVFLVTFSLFVLYYLKRLPSSNMVENISDINEAYCVKTCSQKFYLYCKDYRNSNPASIYDLLDKEYVKKYKIDKNNIEKYIDPISSDIYEINNVYIIQRKDNYYMYLVKGYELYKNTNKKNEFNFVLKIDYKNCLFSIYLNPYIVDNNLIKLNLGDKVDLKIDHIKGNYNNNFNKSVQSIQNNVKDIFSDYKNLCMFYEMYSYEVLSEDNKKEIFPNYEVYDKYILNRFKDIVMSNIIKFETEIKDDNVKYICYDNYGIKYIFNVKSYITYSVKIDDDKKL